MEQMFQALLSEGLLCLPVPDVIKLQLVEAGLVECLLEVVAQTVDGEREEDIAQLKTASDLMVLLLLGGMALLNTVQKLLHDSIHVCMWSHCVYVP